MILCDIAKHFLANRNSLYFLIYFPLGRTLAHAQWQKCDHIGRWMLPWYRQKSVLTVRHLLEVDFLFSIAACTHTLCTLYSRVSQKMKFCDSGQMMCEVILILLFSISSTIRASNAQKPKPKNTLWVCADFFQEVQSIKNAAENYKNKFRGFLVESKYEKWCKFIRNVVQ